MTGIEKLKLLSTHGNKTNDPVNVSNNQKYLLDFVPKLQLTLELLKQIELLCKQNKWPIQAQKRKMMWTFPTDLENWENLLPAYTST